MRPAAPQVKFCNNSKEYKHQFDNLGILYPSEASKQTFETLRLRALFKRADVNTSLPPGADEFINQMDIANAMERSEFNKYFFIKEKKNGQDQPKYNNSEKKYNYIILDTLSGGQLTQGLYEIVKATMNAIESMKENAIKDNIKTQRKIEQVKKMGSQSYMTSDNVINFQLTKSKKRAAESDQDLQRGLLKLGQTGDWDSIDETKKINIDSIRAIPKVTVTAARGSVVVQSTVEITYLKSPLDSIHILSENFNDLRMSSVDDLDKVFAKIRVNKKIGRVGFFTYLAKYTWGQPLRQIADPPRIESREEETDYSQQVQEYYFFGPTRVHYPDPVPDYELEQPQARLNEFITREFMDTRAESEDQPQIIRDPRQHVYVPQQLGIAQNNIPQQLNVQNMAQQMNQLNIIPNIPQLPQNNNQVLNWSEIPEYQRLSAMIEQERRLHMDRIGGWTQEELKQSEMRIRTQPELYSPNASRFVPAGLDQRFDTERINTEQWKSEFYRNIMSRAEQARLPQEAILALSSSFLQSSHNAQDHQLLDDRIQFLGAVHNNQRQRENFNRVAQLEEIWARLSNKGDQMVSWIQELKGIDAKRNQNYLFESNKTMSRFQNLVRKLREDQDSEKAREFPESWYCTKYYSLKEIEVQADQLEAMLDEQIDLVRLRKNQLIQMNDFLNNRGIQGDSGIILSKSIELEDRQNQILEQTKVTLSEIQGTVQAEIPDQMNDIENGDIDEQGLCPVCQGKFQKNCFIVRTQCGHMIHYWCHCAQAYTQCYSCRTPVINVFYDPNSEPIV